MGFLNFKAFNLALLAKQGWRILINPSSFCSGLLKAVYFPNSSGSRPLWIWASIIEGREILLANW